MDCSLTNGNVTKYIYSATGEKLRVIYQTAVPNITVAIGSVRELAPSEIQCADSTDYLLGGNLTLRNGRIDKLQFEEGYCQATEYSGNPVQDEFTFQYYDRDHLGNIRQVVRAASGSNVVQTMAYYPFGAQFCPSSTASEVQSRKYNGKEFDKMHGLNTYDYGARQYNPVTARWDRMDPLCEKYYSISPYAYCGGNPVNRIDPDGREIWIYYNDENGEQQSFQYSVDMECPVNNASAEAFVNNLNTMHKNDSGATVIDAIVGSPTKYGYEQIDMEDTNINGYFDPSNNYKTSVKDANNTIDFAEETFHMYQHVNNQWGTTAVCEVEAKLFSVKMNYEIPGWNMEDCFDLLLGNCDSPYSGCMRDLLFTGYDKDNYNGAVKSFFSGYIHGNLYQGVSGYVDGEISSEPLIKRFLPIQ